MYTQEKDPMIIPFNPDDDDNRASAIMAALLVVFGAILMTVSLWAFFALQLPAPTIRLWHQFTEDCPLVSGQW